MARNNFGTICDMCGSFNSIRFYRVFVPIYGKGRSGYDSNGHGLFHQDLCHNCYLKMQKALENYYNENIKEE